MATPGTRNRMSRAFLAKRLELGIAETLAGNGVKRDVGVAEFVVEERTDHALGQRLANVADLLARLIEGVLDGLSAHRALQVDEDVGEPGPRVGADEIETRRFLQLALDLVDHLVLHFLGRGAGPQHLHDHDAKREVGVLLLPDAHQREAAGRQQQHEQERREVAVIDGPARQVEASRRCLFVAQITDMGGNLPVGRAL